MNWFKIGKYLVILVVASLVIFIFSNDGSAFGFGVVLTFLEYLREEYLEKKEYPRPR